MKLKQRYGKFLAVLLTLVLVSSAVYVPSVLATDEVFPETSALTAESTATTTPEIFLDTENTQTMDTSEPTIITPSDEISDSTQSTLPEIETPDITESTISETATSTEIIPESEATSPSPTAESTSQSASRKSKSTTTTETTEAPDIVGIAAMAAMDDNVIDLGNMQTCTGPNYNINLSGQAGTHTDFARINVTGDVTITGERLLGITLITVSNGATLTLRDVNLRYILKAVFPKPGNYSTSADTTEGLITLTDGAQLIVDGTNTFEYYRDYISATEYYGARYSNFIKTLSQDSVVKGINGGTINFRSLGISNTPSVGIDAFIGVHGDGKRINSLTVQDLNINIDFNVPRSSVTTIIGAVGIGYTTTDLQINELNVSNVSIQANTEMIYQAIGFFGYGSTSGVGSITVTDSHLKVRQAGNGVTSTIYGGIGTIGGGNVSAITVTGSTLDLLNCKLPIVHDATSPCNEINVSDTTITIPDGPITPSVVIGTYLPYSALKTINVTNTTINIGSTTDALPKTSIVIGANQGRIDEIFIKDVTIHSASDIGVGVGISDDNGSGSERTTYDTNNIDINGLTISAPNNTIDIAVGVSSMKYALPFSINQINFAEDSKVLLEAKSMGTAIGTVDAAMATVKSVTLSGNLDILGLGENYTINNSDKILINTGNLQVVDAAQNQLVPKLNVQPQNLWGEDVYFHAAPVAANEVIYNNTGADSYTYVSAHSMNENLGFSAYNVFLPDRVDTVLPSAPAHQATDIALTTDKIILTFNEGRWTVDPDATPTMTLYALAQDGAMTALEQVTLTADMVSENTVTIPFTTQLDQIKTYYVAVDSGAFVYSIPYKHTLPILVDTVTASNSEYYFTTQAKVITYTVTYNSNGGSIIPNETYDSGSYAQEPAMPTRPGFTFAGWYKETTCENKWQFTVDTVTSDITLYALWEQDPTPTLSPTVMPTPTGVTPPITNNINPTVTPTVTPTATPAVMPTVTTTPPPTGVPATITPTATPTIIPTGTHTATTVPIKPITKTGESSNTWLYVLGALVATSAIVIMIIIGKKQKNDEHLA